MDEIRIRPHIQIFGINLCGGLMVNLFYDVVAFRFGHQHLHTDFLETEAIVHIETQVFPRKDNGHDAIGIGVPAIDHGGIQGPEAAPGLSPKYRQLMMAELRGESIYDRTAAGYSGTYF